MFCKKFSVLLCVIALALVADIANADIIGTYVDATTSNTTPGSAILASGEDDYDNLWGQRTQAGTGGGMVLTSNGDDNDNSPMLTTTISGLANGSYDVYAVYWTNNSNAGWNIQAAIAGDTLSAYFQGNGILTGATSDSDKVQRQALLGQALVSDGSFSVMIDDDGDAGLMGAGDYRSWYDGIAYEASAVPEPSTIALLVTGLFGLLAYAWRKRK